MRKITFILLLPVRLWFLVTVTPLLACMLPFKDLRSMWMAAFTSA